MAYRPLADEVRPTSLDQVVGQRHILGPDGLLRRIIESGNIPNLVFYGPSGTGKTTAIPTAPAIADAYFRYDGRLRTSLPLENTPYTRK